MSRPKAHNTEIHNDYRDKERLVNTATRKSLMIPKRKYARLLARDCKHSNYLKALWTLRKQDDHFLENVPVFDDFIVGTETLHFDLPYPIVKPYICSEEIDTCAQIFKEKAKYHERLRNYVHYYRKDQNRLTKMYIENTKYTKLPRYIIDLAVGNVRDPDEQFEGIYNWYYTGGTLSKFCVDNSEYLVCPLPNNNLRIANINDYYNDVEVIEMDRFNLDSKPILNLCVNNDGTGNYILLIRQRNSLNVFHLLKSDNFSLLHILKLTTKDKNPFLDVKHNRDEIASLNYNRKLSIMNLDNNKSKSFKFTKTETDLSDPFCQLEYLDENNMGFIDRNSLRFLDIRSFDEQIIDMKDELFPCNDLCYMKQQEDSPYVFLATVHNIKKFDVRTNKIVKNWAHMLAGQPSMIKIQKFIYGNLIFLSSEKYNERVILCSNESESNLVQLVPNNLESFKKCNILDFNSNNELYEGRLKFSTTGIEVTQNKNISLYTCNSLGDIFQSNARSSKHNLDLTLSEFANWTQNFKKKSVPCIVTHLKDMSNAKYILKKPIRKDALEMYTKPNKKRLEYIAENTIDGTAFAHIWLSNENTSNEALAPSVSADSKVSDWLAGVNNELSEEE